MLELILVALAFFLGGLLPTLLLCHLTRNFLKLLRHLSLLGTATMWWLAWYEYTNGGWFSELAAFADFVAGALVLLGWGLALGIARMKRRNAKCQTEENSGS